MKNFILIILVSIIFTGCGFFEEHEAITLAKQTQSAYGVFGAGELADLNNDQIAHRIATNNGTVEWKMTEVGLDIYAVQAYVRRLSDPASAWLFNFEVNTATKVVKHDGIYLYDEYTKEKFLTNYAGAAAVDYGFESIYPLPIRPETAKPIEVEETPVVIDIIESY